MRGNETTELHSSSTSFSALPNISAESAQSITQTDVLQLTTC